MLRRLGFLIRREERRPVAIAFAFLIGLVASHTALETARDGMFLAKIPGDRLPVVYIAIAIASFAAQRLQSRLRVDSRRMEVAATTAFAGIGTAGFGFIIKGQSEAFLYALYIWSGVITALVLLSFWSLLGTVFSATQAKRLYGVIGIGGMIGGIIGSSGVALFVDRFGPRVVVFASAIGFFVTAMLPRMLPSRDAVRGARERDRAPLLSRFRENVNYSKRGPYVWRLVGIALSASVTVTLTDYVFKSTMAARLPPEQLTAAFGRIYVVLSVLSLVAQLLAVGVLLRRLAPSTVVAMLPLALSLSGALLIGTGGLFAAVLMKGSDGSMRQSLYKTGLELLCVPLSEEGRRRVKAALDVVGQRGGQIVASTLILVLSITTVGDEVTLFALVSSALVWLFLSLRLHRYYVDQFRFSVLTGRDGGPELNQLDAASLETLIATLDSESKDEVLAALAMLEREQKMHLVPALILFHPNEAVVVAALRAFARQKRKLSRHVLDHLIDHPKSAVRAEAYPVRAATYPDPDLLSRALTRETEPAARAAILCSLVASGAMTHEEGRPLIAEVLADTEITAELATLESLQWHRVPEYDDIVVSLASAAERPVRRAAIETLAAIATPEAARTLAGLLREEPLEAAARAALARVGEAGFKALTEVFRDTSLASAQRWPVPRAMAAVDPVRAAPILLNDLASEPDGMVRYRTIVALGMIVERAPQIRLDKAKLKRELRENVSRAYRYIDRRMILEAGVRDDAALKTDGHELLVDLLRDKEQSTIGRVFRLLAVLFPQHQFGVIYRAIESGERLHRAGAVELTSNLLTSPLREAVVGLVDEMDDEARLAVAGPFHEKLDSDYRGLLRALLASKSAIVRDVTAFHVAELGESDLLAALDGLAGDGKGSSDVERAIGVLRGAVSGRARYLSSAPAVANRVG
jgi:ATP:ADP antiporter, AAA family